MTRRSLLLRAFGPVLTARGGMGAGVWPEAVVSVSLGGRHLCPFQNGYLPVCDADRQTITILDSRGNLVSSFRPSLPEAVLIGVFHLAISADRKLVAAVEAKGPDGRYANLLVFCDLQGKIRRIVRTNPFAAVRPLFLSDGRLVCVGREIDEQFDEIKGYHVLRFYSPEGVLLAEQVPIDLLRPTRRDPEPMEWDLAVGDGRIAVLDRDRLRYAEFDERGNVVRPLTSLGFDPPVGGTGLALLPGGRCLIGIEHRRAGEMKDRFALYLLRWGASGLERRLLRRIVPPEGTFGFYVLGAHEEKVVLLATPGNGMIFVPDSAILAEEAVSSSTARSPVVA